MRLAWAALGATAIAYVLTLALAVAVGGAGGEAIAVVVSAWLAYAAIGAVVARRRPENAVGWILLAMGASGVILGFADSLGTFGSERPGSVPSFLLSGWVLGLLLNLWVVAFALVGVLVLVFPTGRPPTPRWRPHLWATAVLVVLGLLTSGPSAGDLGAEGQSTGGFPLIGALLPQHVAAVLIDTSQGIVGIGLMVLTAAAVLALVMRFRRAVGVERQQLKWFAFAASGFVAVYVSTSVSFLIPELRALDPEVEIPVAMFGGVPFIVALILLPIAVAIAVLRYRLYDIDLLINRTLVYGAVSALLAATYLGAVVLFQALLRPFTSGNELAVAGSTLLVVALFQPLRRRVQGAVDRRFYRSRYDATHTLDAFAMRLRDEVDLDSVRADLLDVVRDTIRPAHVSVWLREQAR